MTENIWQKLARREKQIAKGRATNKQRRERIDKEEAKEREKERQKRMEKEFEIIFGDKEPEDASN